MIECEKAGSPVDLKVKDSHGNTALHLAAKHNSLMCCRLLLKNKIPIDEEDSHGNSALVNFEYYKFVN